MTSVLVTGANGFVGRHVVRALTNAGHDVTPLDWPNNLCEVGNVEGFDAVVNLAAIGGVGRAARSPAEVVKNNVGATIALRGALKPDEHGDCPLVVHVSSFSVYGDAPTPTREDAPIAPKELYGASKAMQELAWVGYPGPLWVLRCSSIYGEGMRLDDPESTVIAKIARAARDGTPFPMHEDGSQTRDFVWVGDITRAIKMIVESAGVPGTHHVVNACSGYAVKLRDACETLGARYELTGQTRPGDMRNCFGDATRFRELLGREPTKLNRAHFPELP